MKWYWINLSYATFGIAVSEHTDKVIKTAPIGDWMKGKSISFIEHWVENKKGKIILINS